MGCKPHLSQICPGSRRKRKQSFITLTSDLRKSQEGAVRQINRNDRICSKFRKTLRIFQQDQLSHYEVTQLTIPHLNCAPNLYN